MPYSTLVRIMGLQTFFFKNTLKTRTYKEFDQFLIKLILNLLNFPRGNSTSVLRRLQNLTSMSSNSIYVKLPTKLLFFTQKMWNASRFCLSSLLRGHANLLCIVPILVFVFRIAPVNDLVVRRFVLLK